MAMPEGVIDVEATEAESVEREAPETRRYVQFIFDEKMVEFDVQWTLDEVSKMVTECMKDDGYLWVPYDEEKGLGAFINLNVCTNIKISEREVPKPLEYDEPAEAAPELPAASAAPSEPRRAVEGLCAEYLDRLHDVYGLPVEGTVFFAGRCRRFLTAMLCEKFPGMEVETAGRILDEYREGRDDYTEVEEPQEQ